MFQSTTTLRISFTATVTRDVEVYCQPEDPTVIGKLKAGAIVRAGPGPFMGRVFYSIRSGEGPTNGWIVCNALAVDGESCTEASTANLRLDFIPKRSVMILAVHA